jgi:hypothetical protein
MVSVGKRRAQWILLCVVVGAPSAFLSLEGAFPIALVALVAVVIVSRHWDLVPESVSAFGLSFSIVAARFVIPDLTIYHDLATRTYFLAILGAGIAMVLFGVLRRRPDRWFDF